MKQLSQSNWSLYLCLILVLGVVTVGSAGAQTDQEENDDDSYFDEDLQHGRIYQNSLQQGTLQPGPLQSGSFPQSFSQQGFSQQGFSQPSDLQPSFSLPNGYTPRDPFRSPGPYLGPVDPFSQNNFARRWQPLSFNTDLYQLKPMVIPTGRSLNGDSTRPNAQDYGQQPEVDLYGSDSLAPTAQDYSAPAPSYPPTAPSTATPVVRPVVVRPGRAPSSTAAPSSTTAPSSMGRLTFSVHPADTRILVNDEFLGTGESLSTATGPESLKPGVYAIEAEHNLYETERLMFSLTSDENLHVVIDLTARDTDRGRIDKVN